MNIENAAKKFNSYVVSQGGDLRMQTVSVYKHSQKPAITILYQTGVAVPDISKNLFS
jgi:hypothetical protein